MSYDLHCFKPVDDMTSLEAAELDLEELPPLDHDKVAHVIDEMKRFHSDFELVEEEDDFRVLVDEENELEIAVGDTSVEISFPESADDPEFLIETLNGCLKLLADELGVIIYDPQQNDFVNPKEGLQFETDEDDEDDDDFDDEEEER